MMKKTMKKMLTAGLVTAMVLGSVGVSVTDEAKANDASTEQNYIVQITSEKGADCILDEYREVQTVSLMGEAAVADDNSFTVALNADEVKKVQGKSEIVSVEKDSMLNGFSDKENNKVYEDWKEAKNLQWNLDMIGAKDVDASKVKNKVKVAVIDSGIDYSGDIDVAERKNFVPEQDEVSILYEDGSGHGTGVAGIIAAKDNDEGITGIDENVELYSAKVLDANNQAPISRVVKAIRWAIEKKVNIINLSMGTSVYSEILHDVIQEATEKNILVVCAAGNGGAVQYPAAFDETLAVGSIGADGTVSSESSVGEELDVMAPGEQILSTSAFDGIMASGGTSMAAPHVSGVASRLWEKNIDLPADFIKTLICDSARFAGDNKKYGRGIVDLEYALKNFNEAWDKYRKLNHTSMLAESENIVVEQNTDSIKCFEDCGIIEGRWGTADGTHAEFVDQGVFSGNELRVLKIGAVLQDQSKYGINGKTEHPEFHGYYHYRNTETYTNYIGYYYLLTKMALSYASGSYSDPSMPSWIKDTDNFKELCNVVGGGIGIQTGSAKPSWSSILGNYGVNDRNKSLVLYGMAIHNATDAFAHSAVVDGTRISNVDGDNQSAKQGKYRLNSAKYVAKKMLTHIKNKTRGYVSDFAVPSSITGSKFKMAYISQMASDINSTTYSDNKAAFDALNIETFNVAGIDD